MNIDELEAGRELDALVAEKVMKCKTATKEWNGVLHPFCCCDGSDHEQRCTYVPGMLAYYSTDIAAAWEVVEKLFTLNAFVEIGNDAFQWTVMVIPRSRRDCNYGYGETVHLAICRAALKAVGDLG